MVKKLQMNLTENLFNYQYELLTSWFKNKIFFTVEMWVEISILSTTAILG